MDLNSLRDVKEEDVIVTFDYDSHRLLSDNNIVHTVSDEFVTRMDLENIQSFSYKMTRWFEDKEFDEFNYEGLNLGTIIQVELNYFLVPFMKKFAEIEKITKVYSNAEYISSKEIEPILKKFCTRYKIIENSMLQKNEFYYDSISFSIKISNLNINLKISKEKFLKIKRIFENIVGSYIKQKPVNDKHVLLVEFDPARFSNFFEKTNQKDMRLVVFNRRRPSFTNLKSIMTLKKTKSIVFSENTIDKSRFTAEYRKNELKNKYFEILEKNQSCLAENFAINGNSFFDIIKERFYDLLSRRILFVLSEIELTKALFEKLEIGSVLIWSEMGLTERIVINFAKKRNIPIILLQHGYFFDDESVGTYEMNLFQGVFPIASDQFLVWGNIERDHQIRAGISDKIVYPLGSLYYDDKIYADVKEEFVLLATSGPVKENAFDLTIKTIEKNIEAIRQVSKTVTKNGKKLIIKVHPSPDEFDPSNLIKSIDKNIQVVKTGDIFELIKSCILLVVIDVSTVILDAQIIGKPIISVNVKDSGFGIPSIISSNLFPSVEIDGFEQAFLKIINDTNFKKNIIDSGKKFSNNYINNLGNASEKIIEHISTLHDESKR